VSLPACLSQQVSLYIASVGNIGNFDTLAYPFVPQRPSALGHKPCRKPPCSHPTWKLEPAGTTRPVVIRRAILIFPSLHVMESSMTLLSAHIQFLVCPSLVIPSCISVHSMENKVCVLCPPCEVGLCPICTAFRRAFLYFASPQKISALQYYN
jgi:hypothetical protein